MTDFIEIARSLRCCASNCSDRCIKGLGDLPPAFSQSYPQIPWTAGFNFKIIDLALILEATPSYRRYLLRV
ncbi:MAG: hypothetical protein OEW27_05970 [Aquincola sp.]|nr:hypothetical protein [Aquincola sp.]MDH5329475.1 hypothetical protein [Aquincola sp.]